MCGRSVSTPTESHGASSPLERANLWSLFWFAWSKPLLDLGCERPLDWKDLPPIAEQEQSRFNQQHIERLWEEEKKNRRPPSLARAMAIDYLQSTWASRLLIMLNSLSKVIQAAALGILLEKLEETVSSTSSNNVTSSGYFWAGVIILCGMVAFPTKQHSFFHLYRKGAQYRSGLMAAIYAKTLRLPSIRNHQVGGTSGHVTNLASNDVERFLLTSIYANLLLASPVEVVTILLVGLYTIGPVFLCGYAILAMLLPLQFWLSRRFVYLRSSVAHSTDARVTLVSQAITGSRVLKLQGWELEWERKIAQLRAVEVQQLQNTNRLKACNDAVYYCSSLVVSVAVLSIYVSALEGTLTPRIVFTTFTLWNLLQYSVTKHIPHAIMGLSECYVACQRIQNFLDLPELETAEASGESKSKKFVYPATTTDESADETALIQLSNATCCWNPLVESTLGPYPEKNDDIASSNHHNLALQNVSLQIRPGELYCVIGKVGSGKSAILQALIGELPLTSGHMKTSYNSISYAAQDPWIMDGTARENIVMGNPFDPIWYNSVVQACCLESDFDNFLQGDQTIVGDRGVQCSGGQKARLALARALYCDSEVLVLDDPLSAVDAKVAHSIYFSAIRELAVERGKAVVLVTHQHQFVGGKDNVCILMDNGKLICCSSFAECVEKSGGDLSAALQTSNDIEVVVSPAHHDTADAQDSGGDLESKKDAALTEKRTTGIIKSRTWLSYGSALGGLVVCTVFLSGFAATQALFLVTITFVGKWAERPEEEQNTTHWYGLVFGLTAATILLAIIRAQMSFHLFLQASKRLHNQMLRSVLRATVEFYDTNPLGRILNRFAADVGITDELLPFTIYDFGVGLIMFVGSIITAIVILPLVLAVFPVLLWIFVRLKGIFVKTTRELKRLEGLGRSPIYAMMSESLAGVATIRANRKTSYFSNKYESQHDALIQAQFAFIAVSRWFATQLDFLSFVFLTAATLCAVLIHSQGWFNLDPAVVGLALSLLLQLAGSNFPFMVRQSAEVTNHMVSVERIWEFGNSIPQEAPLQTEMDLEHEDWPKEPSIVVENLCVRYRENLPPCLSNVSFAVSPGERVGVVGRTGAGKTSLLQALFRVLEAEAGSIQIGGVAISQLGLHKLRTNMAVITQAPVLFSGCTIRENLDPYPSSSADTLRLEEALRSVHMWETIQSIPEGVDGLVAESGTNFSVGQRQLLCLARACLADCKILILDEATANVDQATDTLLQQTLRERFSSATIIAIAHRLETIMDYDKVLVLGNGSVVEFGPPCQLLQNKEGVFTSMVESTGTSMAVVLKDKAAKSRSS